MRNPVLLICLAAAFSACGEQPGQQAVSEDAETVVVGEVQWIHDDFEAAFALAAREGKSVFIDFYADWCPPCRTLSDEYFPRADYQEFLSGVVPLKVNVDNQQDFAQRYGVSSIPTLVLTDALGNELDRVVGVTGTPEDFLQVLKALGE